MHVLYIIVNFDILSTEYPLSGGVFIYRWREVRFFYLGFYSLG